MALFNPGDPFPTITIQVGGGETLTLPDALAGDCGVVLFYAARGARTATPSSRPFSAPPNSWPRSGRRWSY